jgi:hypothetical protein
MRLNVAAVTAREVAHSAQKRLGTAGHEARRQDRQHPLLGKLRPGAQRFREGQIRFERGLRRRVTVVLGAQVRLIHGDPPDERAQAPLSADGRELLRADQVIGCKQHRCGRAIRQQGFHQRDVH